MRNLPKTSTAYALIAFSLSMPSFADDASQA
ncbi:hypothetical protein ACVIJ6_003278 [Bradyrhizobium sp. USDA 4369]